MLEQYQPFPLNYGFDSDKQLINLPLTPAKNKIQKILVLGSSANGISLNANDLENLLDKVKGTGKTVPFHEAGLKFDNVTLKEEDRLISPCQDGKYYLAKYKGGRTGLEHELENGQIVYRFSCWDVKNKGLKNVTLDWTKPSRDKPYLSLITAGSCTFSSMDNSKIKIQCHEHWNNKEKRGSRNNCWRYLDIWKPRKIKA